jgi:hypothetical protein
MAVAAVRPLGIENTRPVSKFERTGMLLGSTQTLFLTAFSPLIM